jgi:hypothetical protein
MEQPPAQSKQNDVHYIENANHQPADILNLEDVKGEGKDQKVNRNKFDNVEQYSRKRLFSKIKDMQS